MGPGSCEKYDVFKDEPHGACEEIVSKGAKKFKMHSMWNRKAVSGCREAPHMRTHKHGRKEICNTF